MAKKFGQISFVPTDEQRELVAALSSAGIPQDAICKFVKWPEIPVHADSGKPIGQRTLRKVFKREIADGMAITNARLMKAAIKVAVVDEDRSMLIFLLKTRLGFKEPAQEVSLSMSYAQLIDLAQKKAEESRKEKAALTVIEGGKAAA